MEKYIFDEYSVSTTDGYILKLFRISESLKSSPTQGKAVVFLMHGLLCSSADWLVLGENKALPYLFADAGEEIIGHLIDLIIKLILLTGFDVFLGNARETLIHDRILICLQGVKNFGIFLGTKSVRKTNFIYFMIIYYLFN